MSRQFYIPTPVIYTQEDGTENIFIRNEELGHGSFAVVYRVTLQNTNETYAMKVVSKQLCLGPRGKKLTEKLKSEIAIQRIVNHPNVVKSKYIFSDDYNYYFILEYCPGNNMRDYLKKSINSRISETEARKVLKDVLKGLIYLHSHEIVHYDIKLENFLIDKNGNVKIADFGLSVFKKDEEGKRFSLSGTPNYLSPEMLHRETREQSYKVDIWAVGVSAFMMLTGKGPFEASTKEQTFENIKNCAFSFPQKVEISDEAKNFIKTILTIDKTERPSAKELLVHPFITKSDNEIVQLLKHNRLPQLFRDAQSPQKVQTGDKNNGLPPIKINTNSIMVSPRRVNNPNKAQSPRSPSNRNNLNMNAFQSPRSPSNRNNANMMQSPRFSVATSSGKRPHSPRILPSMGGELQMSPHISKASKQQQRSPSIRASRKQQTPRILPSMEGESRQQQRVTISVNENIHQQQQEGDKRPSTARNQGSMQQASYKLQTEKPSLPSGKRPQTPRILPSMEDKKQQQPQKVAVPPKENIESQKAESIRRTQNPRVLQSMEEDKKQQQPQKVTMPPRESLNTQHQQNSRILSSIEDIKKQQQQTQRFTVPPRESLNTQRPQTSRILSNTEDSKKQQQPHSQAEQATARRPQTPRILPAAPQQNAKSPRLPSLAADTNKPPRISVPQSSSKMQPSQPTVTKHPPLRSLENHNPNISSITNPDESKGGFNIPSYFISRYCFYNDNLSYLLLDGTVGVCFKDDSRIVMDPNERFVQYYKYINSKAEVIELDDLYDTQNEIKMKSKEEEINFVKKVAKNFKKIRFSFDIQESDYDVNMTLHNVNCYVKNEDSILFKLNDKNIQVNFNDYKKLIIFWNTKKMCFFKNFREKCNLLDMKYVASMNSNSDEVKKYKKSKEMLSNLAITI